MEWEGGEGESKCRQVPAVERCEEKKAEDEWSRE